MRPFDFENSFGYLFCATAHILRRSLDESLAAEGITSRQWEVLAVLSRQGALPQHQLAECLGIAAPAMAGVVSRMQRDGWLHREPCQEDRRRMIIAPTDKAAEVWSRSIDCIYRMRDQLLAGLTDADLESLRHICGTIRENVSGNGGTPEPMADPMLAEHAVVPERC